MKQRSYTLLLQLFVVVIELAENPTDKKAQEAVKEAEKYAEEDKKRKEEVETRNNAESMVYQCEKNHIFKSFICHIRTNQNVGVCNK